MYHNFLIHSFTDGHLGCFQHLAIMNCAAMNIGVHKFFWIGVSGFIGYNPSSGIAGSKGLSRHFCKEGIQRAQRYMKGCSASLTIRQMQIKTTMNCHFTPLRMAIINKSTNTKCWQGCGEKGTLVHYWLECKLVQLLWKSVYLVPLPIF